MEFELLYHDESIAVINKPAGLLSIPGRGPGMQDSAALRIRRKFPDCIDQPSVHRLDMDTSGLMVFALTREAHRTLSIQFQKGEVCKKYIALLNGQLDKSLGESGRIELKFRLDPDNRPYQIFDPVRGKTGVTLWRILGEEYEKTRVIFTPLTGRTHQLRIHSAHPPDYCYGENRGGLGYPIIGDRLYGNSNDEEHASGVRMMLHASKLEFTHPVTGEKTIFESHPPF